jgi:hypothetical protein
MENNNAVAVRSVSCKPGRRVIQTIAVQVVYAHLRAAAAEVHGVELPWTLGAWNSKQSRSATARSPRVLFARSRNIQTFDAQISYALSPSRNSPLRPPSRVFSARNRTPVLQAPPQRKEAENSASRYPRSSNSQPPALASRRANDLALVRAHSASPSLRHPVRSFERYIADKVLACREARRCDYANRCQATYLEPFVKHDR